MHSVFFFLWCGLFGLMLFFLTLSVEVIFWCHFSIQFNHCGGLRLSPLWWKLIRCGNSLGLARCHTNMELQPSNVGNAIGVARVNTANPPHPLCSLGSHWLNRVGNLELWQFTDSRFKFLLNFTYGEASACPTFSFLGFWKKELIFFHQFPK